MDSALTKLKVKEAKDCGGESEMLPKRGDGWCHFWVLEGDYIDAHVHKPQLLSLFIFYSTWFPLCRGLKSMWVYDLSKEIVITIAKEWNSDMIPFVMVSSRSRSWGPYRLSHITQGPWFLIKYAKCSYLFRVFPMHDLWYKEQATGKRNKPHNWSYFV